VLTSATRRTIIANRVIPLIFCRELNPLLRKSLSAALLLLVVFLPVACDRSASISSPEDTPPRVREGEIIASGVALMSGTLPVPGNCTFGLTIPENSGTSGGAMPLTATPCVFPDSALVRIRVSGSITYTSNPNYTCCGGTGASAVGTWGPKGSANLSTWMGALVAVRLTFGNGTSTEYSGTLPLGSSATDVPYFEGSFVRRSGATLSVKRNGIGEGPVSCRTSGDPAVVPPGCVTPGGAKAHQYSAPAYLVSGQETMHLERLSRTLQVVPSTAPFYEGDVITFTASSTDGRGVSVREWIWRDTTGVLSAPSCSGTSNVCQWAPPTSGTMFVRARVGTNGFIEQAFADISLLPVLLVLTPSPQNAVGLDSVQLIASSIPSRPIQDLALIQPPIAMLQARRTAAVVADSDAVLYQVTCGTVTSTTCSGIALAGGTLRVSATVNGRPKSASNTLAVAPLEVNVIVDGAVGDSSILDASAAGRDCDAMAGSLLDGYEVQGTPTQEVRSRVIHKLHPGRNLGPGLVTLSPPYTMNGDIVQFVTYNTVWTPTAYYRPFYASLTTENAPVNWVWSYVPLASRGALFYCESRFDGQRFSGRLTYANRMDVAFFGFYSR
jgi:hypothetical protein